MKDVLLKLAQVHNKPDLFEQGEPHFWDDPHISKGMLEAHLSSDHDAASRKMETIEKTVQNLLSSGVLKPGMKVLDLGCGPGLYAQRLTKAGVHVVGLDISERSLNYAKEKAKEADLNIEYRLMNFLEMDYVDEFDVAVQVYGEICVFPDTVRDALLTKIHQALKPQGHLVFDVSTRDLRLRHGTRNSWYMSEEGFWAPGRHLVLQQGFDYPQENVWLDQYTVIEENNCKVYRNWFHDYSLEQVEAFLAKNHFVLQQAWNDLTGMPYQAGGDWIAVVARKS